MRQYTENAAVTFFIFLSVLGWFANWGVQTLLSTRLNSHSYGDIFVFIQLISFAGMLCTYGLTNTVYNIVPSLQKNKGVRFFHWSLSLLIQVATFFCATGLCLIVFLQVFMPTYLPYSFLFNLCIILAIPLTSLSLFLSALLSVLGKKVISTTIQLIFTPLYFALFIFIFERLTLPLHQSLFALPIVVTILTLITAASFFIFFQYQLISTPASSSHTRDHQLWQLQNRQFFITQIFLLSRKISPILILEIVGTTEHEIGVFGAISTLASLLIIIQNTCYYSFLQPQTQQLLHDNRKKLQSLITNTNMLVYGLSIIISSILIAFSHFFLGSFGAFYVDYWPALLILLICKLVDLSNDTSWVLCSMSKEGSLHIKKTYQYIFFIEVILFATTGYFFGLNGVLVSTIITSAILSLSLIRKAKALYDLKVWFFF